MKHGFSKNQEAMKGGKACGIHRAMKYTSVDPRIMIGRMKNQTPRRAHLGA